MKPNILFMISHDNGYKVATPSIHEMAENGFQFN